MKRPVPITPRHQRLATRRRRVAVLGSTGSIGRNTLEVVAALPERFEIVALAAGVNIELLAEQTLLHRPKVVSLRTPDAAEALRNRLRLHGKLRTKIVSGAEGLREAAADTGADIVVAAVVGIAALSALLAVLERGCDLAIANKEALVVAGPLLTAEAARTGARILPIDSEHSAIHQCLRSGDPAEIRRLILTASGGPFLRLDLNKMAHVTPAQALQHPTWRMGSRVTLDSATLMNKGFEIIEACHLFHVEESKIEVLVHPQSIMHSMVEFRDGSVIGQLGTADMRTPIQYALTYPERAPSARIQLKLEEIGRLEFEPVDGDRFPCLGLAREVARCGGVGGAVLNAADEEAVAAFAAGRIPFSAISRIVEETLSQSSALGAKAVTCASSLELVLEADAQARRTAQRAMARWGARAGA